jgi:hypothetical protein
VALILDTGVLFAALNEEDPEHLKCGALLTEASETLVVPDPVLVELEYWMRKIASPDAWLAFCEDVHGGAYSLHPLDSATLLAASRLQVRYADLSIGLVDAAVFVTCDVLGERKVATLDQRHFRVLRTEDGKSLELLPE